MTIQGLGDVTENCTNPLTDFTKSAAMGCKRAFVRATTTGAWNYTLGKPTLKVDAMLAVNYNKLAAVGIAQDLYGWFDPRPQLTPQEQSDFYISTVNKVGPFRRPVVDVENSGSVAVYNAASVIALKTYCANVQAAFPTQKLEIYTFPAFMYTLQQKADVSWMLAYDLVVAHWDVPAPTIPYPWWPGAQVAWQYTAVRPGAQYGFYLPAPRIGSYAICMATWNEQ
jgi:GH25 family lysozyme M1 (1,4-beta-N-acetylmuramidase)